MVTRGRRDPSCPLIRQKKPPITHSSGESTVTRPLCHFRAQKCKRPDSGTRPFIIRFPAATSISSVLGAPTRTVPLVQASPSPFQDLALLVPTPVYHPSILSLLFFCRRGDNRSASLSTSKVEMSRGATRDVHTYAHTLNLDLKRPFRPYCSATLNTNCSV